MAGKHVQSSAFNAESSYVGQIYARALLGAAAHDRSGPAVVDELEALVAEVLDRLPSFEAALASPRVPVESKLRMLEAAFAGRMSRHLLILLKVMAERGRLGIVRQVATAARRLLNELHGRLEVELRSAQPLSSDAIGVVAARLRAAFNSDVDLETLVDPRIIGGLVIRIGDTLYDGSVRNQLERLRAATLEHAADAARQQLDRFVSAG